MAVDNIAFTQAARAIVDKLSDSMDRDNAEAMVSRLFRVGVIYMPVPRCDTCKYWDFAPGETVGDCYRPDSPASKYRLASRGDGVCMPLETDADFGCVQWGAVDAVPTTP